MGAGPLPVDAHRRRPPIPIVPVDEAARAAAGADERRAWLAGVTGDPSGAAPRVRTIDAADVDVLHTTLAARRATPGMSVGEVALAVDAGRALAARAAADGVQLLVEDANPEVVRYLNRLSDLLFILSRGANAGEEPLWEPGRFQ